VLQARAPRAHGLALALALAQALTHALALALALVQVYKGRLKTGEQVAVKVQRPSIGESIAVDMLLLRRLMAAVDDNLPQVGGGGGAGGGVVPMVVVVVLWSWCWCCGAGNWLRRTSLPRHACGHAQQLLEAQELQAGGCAKPPRPLLPLQISQPLVPLVDEFACRLFAELDYVQVRRLAGWAEPGAGRAAWLAGWLLLGWLAGWAGRLAAAPRQARLFGRARSAPPTTRRPRPLTTTTHPSPQPPARRATARRSFRRCTAACRACARPRSTGTSPRAACSPWSGSTASS
jgi:hypothetical protein